MKHFHLRPVTTTPPAPTFAPFHEQRENDGAALIHGDEDETESGDLLSTDVLHEARNCGDGPPQRANFAAVRRLQQAEIRVVEALGLAGEISLGLWDESHVDGLLRSLAGALADLRQLERQL